jgi:tight adherence protein C
MLQIVIYTLILVSLFIFFYILLAALFSYLPRPKYILKETENTLLLRPQEKKGIFEKGAFILDKFKFLNYIIHPVSKIGYLKKLAYQTEILNINISMPVLILIKIIFSVVGGILAFILFTPSYALLAVLIGFFLPDYLMITKIRGKKEEIARVFPETIDLLDMCIGAGADLMSAIKWVIDKSGYNPFIEQLSVVVSEVKVGKSRQQALKDMAKRLQITEINSFVRTVVQAERMGTSIEEAFRNLSADTRNMRFQAGERYAIKASLKILFPLMFCILPAIMIVVAGPIIVKFMQGDLVPKGF